MIRQSIRRRVVAIAVGLIVLMVATSVLSMVMVGRVGRLLDELTTRYTPVNTHLTRINILSFERALALRRMVIAKMQDPPDEIGYKTRKQLYDAKDSEVDSEAQAARKLINAIIEDTSTPSDNAALARIESRIDSLMSDARRYLKQETGELLSVLEARDFAAVRRSLARVDTLRDELDDKIDAVAATDQGEHGAIAEIRSEQEPDVELILMIVTCLRRIVGLVPANLVGRGISRSGPELLGYAEQSRRATSIQSIDVTMGLTRKTGTAGGSNRMVWNSAKI